MMLALHFINLGSGNFMKLMKLVIDMFIFGME